jgi:hypothetical protein
MSETIILDGRKEVFPKNEKLPEGGGVDIFSFLVESGTTVPAWWSRHRDLELRRFWHSNDHVAGAFYAFISRLTSVPIRVEAKDQSVKTHVEQAAEYTDLLWYATSSRSDMTTNGWVHGWGMFIQDLLTQDNGAFFIVEGPGRPEGPLTGRPTKLIHLDSQRVTRKGNEEYPIVYENYDGKLYKIHESRVIAMSSLPSAQQRMYGVGFCALSRCINYAQILTDILIYKQEKLGSRPKERLIIGKKGITAEDIARAFMVADDQMNSMGLSRYSKTVVLAPNVRSSSAEVDISVEDLVQAGQVFDEGQSMMLGMNTIALALGVPTRWLWPATATGATKADAQFQHLAGMVQGPGEIIRAVKLALEAKFLPPHLVISVDYQDDEQDRQQAEIRNTRATQRKTDIEDSVITVRVAREQALSSGDITQAQFDQMELDDGRLPSGDPVVALFNTSDTYMAELLDLGVDNPIDVNMNDPIDMLIKLDDAAFIAMGETQTAPSFQRKSKARQVLAALAVLKELYDQRAMDEITPEVVEEINMQSERTEPGVLPEEAPAETTEEVPAEAPEGEVVEGEAVEEVVPEEKAYNFSAGGGEVIGGNLARDPEGKFISKDELSAAIRSRLLDRLRGRRGEEEDGPLTPEKQAENREKVLEELSGRFPNFPVGGMDGLTALGQGVDPGPAAADALVNQGLAKRNDDGSVQLSSQGASFLIASNKGNTEDAAEALIRAQASKPAPKAPKAAAGGAAPKEDKPKEDEKPIPDAPEGEEEIEETPEEKKERIARENRAKIAEELADEELTLEAIEKFQLFIDGAELETPEDVQLFARLGFIDIGSKGEVRLSTDGRRFMAAANKGDVRAAKDALSRAREGVAIEDPNIEDLPPDASGGPSPGQPAQPPAPFRKSVLERVRERLNV